MQIWRQSFNYGKDCPVRKLIFIFAEQMKGKAIFLLITFLLNYLVGFACDLHEGISAFQKNEAAHVHSSHHHSESTDKHNNHPHGDNDHHASQSEEAVSKNAENSSNETGNCCKDKISKFDSLSKIKNQSGRIITDAPVIDVVPNKFSSFVPTGQSTRFGKYFSNRQRPPNFDIRILIQSFQI